jgi:hypothetical protein
VAAGGDVRILRRVRYGSNLNGAPEGRAGSGMAANQEPHDLEQLLDRIADAARERDRVPLQKILDHVGRRSFGPLLLVGGVVALAPIVGDIPGVPTATGVFVLLVTVQLLFGRKHFWLPRWLLERSAPRDKVCKALEWLRPPARFVDRFLRPRLTVLTRGTATWVVALVSAAIAATMPAMEVIPFAANVAGAALTAFGLALIARDGAMVLLAFAFTGATIGFVVYNVL